MARFLIVATGGAIGTVLRYFISGLDHRFSVGSFPLNTLIVNVTGSLVIGLLWGVVDHFAFSSNIKIFIFVGILGGYTTFSTFSLETFHLMQGGEYRLALMNICLSMILSVVAVFIGFFISRTVVQLWP